MAKLVLIKSVSPMGTFFRLGKAWTVEGTVVNAADFREDEWQVLVNEPMLHIGPAPDGAEAEKANDAALRDLVKDALGKLEAGDFAEDGQPKADAVRKHLPKGTKGVTTTLIAEVWAELKGAA